MKKQVAAIALSAALFSVPVTSVVNAEIIDYDSTNQINEVNDSQAEVVKAYITTENGLREISLTEYNNLISQEQPPVTIPETVSSNNIIRPDADTGYDFVSTRKFVTSGVWKNQLQVAMKTDITDYIKNTSKTTNISQAVTWQKSYQWTANASISGKWFDTITGTLGAGWSTTDTYSYSSTLTVKPGYKAKLQFTPLYNVAQGDLIGYNFIGTVLERVNNVTIKSPVKLAGGKVQGVITVVEQKL